MVELVIRAEIKGKAVIRVGYSGASMIHFLHDFVFDSITDVYDFSLTFVAQELNLHSICINALANKMQIHFPIEDKIIFKNMYSKGRIF